MKSGQPTFGGRAAINSANGESEPWRCVWPIKARLIHVTSATFETDRSTVHGHRMQKQSEDIF